MNPNDAAAVIRYVEARLALQEFLTGRRLNHYPPSLYQVALEAADAEVAEAVKGLRSQIQATPDSEVPE